MPRPMSAAMQTALSASILYPAILVQMGFASGTAYIWSGVGSITWNGHTYLGVGDFGGSSIIEEGSNVEARGIVLTLSGIDPTMLGDALQELQLGLPVTVYLALYSTRGGSPPGTLIADPLISWSGRMDQPEILLTGDKATINVKCESRLLDMNVPVDRRLTVEDIGLRNPGDIGGSFVFAIQEVTINWGAAPQANQNI